MVCLIIEKPATVLETKKPCPRAWLFYLTLMVLII
jgi:hypothetical protein